MNKFVITINGQKILVDMIGYISQIRLIHKDKKTLTYTYGIVPKLDMANLISAIPTCYVNSGLILCKISDGDKL